VPGITLPCTANATQCAGCLHTLCLLTCWYVCLVLCCCSLQFPEVFWDSSIDYFGVTQPPGEDTRGRCFMFWNLARFNDGAPLLAALVSGRSARAAEGADTQELQQHMLEVCAAQGWPGCAQRDCFGNSLSGVVGFPGLPLRCACSPISHKPKPG
jgi:hypothetical protein